MNDLVIGLALGFMTAAWLGTIGVGVYILRQWVFKPWTVMRQDVVNLDAKLNAIVVDLGARKATSIDPNQQAIQEQKQRMQRAMRQFTEEVV